MPSQRALLIASSYNGLQGPLNDVKMMEDALSALGFTITKCCNAAATREGILLALNQLTNEISLDDAVVVYYSGHGGLVESQLHERQNTDCSNIASSWRYQFIVPVDYHMSVLGDFRGILDIELSGILHAMTERTKNVTIFLDCCYASRMVREPGLGDEAVPRSISGVQYHDISKHANCQKSSNDQQKGLYNEENSLFVCIAAAAATETAWEYRNSRGEWCGAMTEALVKVFSESRSHRISWRASLFRISELVNVTFPDQHPHLAGPGDRYYFSLSESTTDGLYIRNEADGAVIQAGKISGVLEGNVYSIMSHGAKTVNIHEQLGEAQVVAATAFRAVVRLDISRSGVTSLPENGAVAFLKNYVLPKWPVTVPPGIPWLEAMVHGSRFIRLQDPLESGFALAIFRVQPNGIALYTNHGLEVIRTPFDASQEQQLNLQKAVELLARAQHLLGLKNDNEDEYLHHRTRIEFDILDDRTIQRIIRGDGTDSVLEDSYTCIQLTNEGQETVYISIFNINAVGKVSRVSRVSGVELPPGRKEIILRQRNPPLGLQITWPKGLPRAKPLAEILLFILTNSPVDLCHLATPVESPASHRLGLSRLEQLTWSIASGSNRNANAVEDENILCYTTHRIAFNLVPKAT